MVFDHLYNEIVTLGLLPGAKMSEAEIATQFGISRQPVRDAFSKLDTMGFLLIRPQKATVVKKFSIREVETTRFVRMALEVEVARQACENWEPSMLAEFETCLEAQTKAISFGDMTAFQSQDDEFHKLLCKTAGVPFAFAEIEKARVQVNRLCVLGITRDHKMNDICEDHRRILAALMANDKTAIEMEVRSHLGRMDKTIATVRTLHPDYFSE